MSHPKKKNLRTKMSELSKSTIYTISYLGGRCTAGSHAELLNLGVPGAQKCILFLQKIVFLLQKCLTLSGKLDRRILLL
jgi:hypothetical protein